jgi:hypothetical protein
VCFFFFFYICAYVSMCGTFVVLKHVLILSCSVDEN